jgi:hypothetical protein
MKKGAVCQEKSNRKIEYRGNFINSKMLGDKIETNPEKKQIPLFIKGRYAIVIPLAVDRGGVVVFGIYSLWRGLFPEQQGL